MAYGLTTCEKRFFENHHTAQVSQLYHFDLLLLATSLTLSAVPFHFWNLPLSFRFSTTTNVNQSNKENMVVSERLVLRNLAPTDAAFIYTLLNSPGWLQFIGDRGIKTLDDARNYIESGPMKSYELNGFGLMLVEHSALAVPIGICGLIKRDTLPDLDLGFAFLPEFASKGYGFEAATAIMRHAKSNLNISHLLAITNLDNEISIALLHKLGFQFQRLITFDKDELRLYACTF
jgi:[ribosomal protein S5]-alanine N-acetyltransferase